MAQLTTEHNASNYAKPVLVLQDGTTLGIGDIWWLQLAEATAQEREALIAAGYRFS